MAFADLADVVERRFESHIIDARPERTRYRSLTDTQLQIVRTLISPGAAENPFPERLQLRNWLMIELLLETGIRRGELLKLYTTDINQGSQHAYVTINDREHDPVDPRAEEPALKTHGRTVGISAQLYEVYEHYIQSERRPLRDGKPMKLLHRYLFISDRGRPLSIRALSNVLDRLFLTIELAHPGLLLTLSAHDFRHTFADRTWSSSVGTTWSAPRTNSGESAVGLRLRRCHVVMQVVIYPSRPTAITRSVPRQLGADLTVKEVRRA